MLNTLSSNDVRAIYGALVEHFTADQDPIQPAGIRDVGLLESAVSRQLTGSGDVLKYPEPRHNAASVLYGICQNHPFHNGNKRTSLVAALVHLERNGYIPHDVSQDDFYRLVRAVAKHDVQNLKELQKDVKNLRKRKCLLDGRLHADDEVELIAAWLRDVTRLEDRRERPLTWRQLKRILQRFKCDIDVRGGNFIKITGPAIQSERTFLGIVVGTKEFRPVKTLSYSGDGFQVTIATIKDIRRDFGLTIDKGCDSKTFYEFDGIVDSILCQYRGLLKRLAKV